MYHLENPTLSQYGQNSESHFTNKSHIFISYMYITYKQQDYFLRKTEILFLGKIHLLYMLIY